MSKKQEAIERELQHSEIDDLAISDYIDVVKLFTKIHTKGSDLNPDFTLTDPRDKAINSRLVTFARQHLLSVNVLRTYIQDQPLNTSVQDKYGTWQKTTETKYNPYRDIIAAYLLKDLTNLVGLTRSNEAQVLLSILKYGQTAQQIEETDKKQQGFLSRIFNPQKKEEENT